MLGTPLPVGLAGPGAESALFARLMSLAGGLSEVTAL
jgi:hypothetical protein